ncbi:hotdog domain-containing protein [Methylobacterium brachiatum]|uniref:Hotdog domain-containing protein n=1 Tax=Methylobacterium brachiatum TaxID=269660 RepID=A0ABV1R742_9HYPH
MRILMPISFGDEVSLDCALQERGDSSTVVKIEIWARDRSEAYPENVTEGVLT